MDTTQSPAVELDALTFTYALGRPPVVRAASLSIPRGARLVLVGANGAGKSTLMGLVAGKRKPTGGRARALGEEAFETTTLTNRITFVTNDWVLPVNLPVAELLASAAVGIDPARVRELVEALDARALLGSDVGSLSDGQRRRVQLLCTLLPPRELVLLDEVTNSLDVLARARLLRWLREAESERRGATVVFCSHIFDGLDGWATHVAHVDAGAIAHALGPDAIPRDRPLHETVARWLADDATRAQGTAEYRDTHAAGARALDKILADAAARGEARRAALAARTPLAVLANAGAGVPAPECAPRANAGDARAHGDDGDDGEGALGASAWKKARADPPDGTSAAAQRPPAAAATPADASGAAADARDGGDGGDGGARAGSAAHADTQAAAWPPPAQPPREARPPGRPRLARQLPADAARLQVPLEAALAAVEASTRDCLNAVADGDVAALAAARGRVAQLWAGAQLALAAFEKAAGGAPPTAAAEPAQSGGGGGASALPFGWGSRHASLPEEALLSRGVIVPPPTRQGAEQ